MSGIFTGRQLLIATKHRKEEAIIPVIQPFTGIIPFVPADFDTDAFGTFCGEKLRIHSPRETARQKCLSAMDRYGADLAIASEGSFGPHPFYPFLAGGEEWLILIDKKFGLEIECRKLTSDTNFGSREPGCEKELLAFAEQSGFPSHGLILSCDQKELKGIQTHHELLEAWKILSAKGQKVKAETDMRACYNPTRMKSITETASGLLEKIMSICPRCKLPGFSTEEIIPGLPCSLCGSATGIPISEILLCRSCDFREEKRVGGNDEADPSYCFHCNP